MSEEIKYDEGGFEKQERMPARFSIKRFLPRTLFARSLLILITPIILIQVFTTYMFFERHWNKITSRLAYAVSGEIAILADALEYDDNAADVTRVIQYSKKYLSLDVNFDRGAELDLTQTNESEALWESLFAKRLKRELSAQLERPFVIDIAYHEKWVSVLVQLDNGVLSVTLPQGRLFSSSGYIFLLWVFGSSILLLAIAVLFMRNQIRPIRKLAAAAKRLGKGRDVPAFKPEGAREVRDAAQAFMDMHRRIKRQVSQRTAMLAGVSHDLRTPLTRLKLQLAMMDGKDVKHMKSDIAEMEAMIDGYLDFVRGEGGEQTRITDLNALFEKIAKTAQRDGVNIHLNVRGRMMAMIRPLGLERCISNLISNARKYAHTVWIEAHINDERKLVIMIDDDGPGIPEDQYQEVFKPFYRMDKSRNSQTGGVGLGLPIAMDVVHSHGGKIWLEKSQRGGLRVMIRMPV